MLRWAYDRTIALANRRHASTWLAAVAFAESSFFPIPPDVLLLPMALADRRRVWILATICTLASVAGGILGYAIGYYLFEIVGNAIIEFYGLTEEFSAFQATFLAYGAWIVALKGLTPVPYKLVTIAAGVATLDLQTFVIASIVARGMRFYMLALLLDRYGAPMRDFIERRLGLVTLGLVAFVVGGFFVIKIF
jgi:membrane protein YqaA with SNARE-associated domain